MRRIINWTAGLGVWMAFSFAGGHLFSWQGALMMVSVVVADITARESEYWED